MNEGRVTVGVMVLSGVSPCGHISMSDEVHHVSFFVLCLTFTFFIGDDKAGTGLKVDGMCLTHVASTLSGP